MLKGRQRRIALFAFLFLFIWVTPYMLHAGFEGFPTTTLDPDGVQIGPEEIHTPAVGENWLGGYHYRKRIHINAISGAGSGYQIKFLVERTTGTDNDYNVHVSTKCQSNYGDVRWTNYGGTGLENYWIQEGYTSSSAWMWVRVSANLASATDLYIYYGTVGTTVTTSSISSTFWVGDEFKDSSTSGWSTSVPQGSISEDSDDMHIYSGTNGDWWGGAIHNAPIAYRSWAGSGYCAYWKLNSYTVGASTHSGVMFYSSRDNAYMLGNYYSSAFRLEKIIGDIGYQNIASTSGYKYYMQLRQVSSTEYYDYYTTDATPQYTYSNLYSNTEIVASYVGMFAKEYGASTVTSLYDYFFVRKYTTSESSAMYGSWYSEETAVPVNDAAPYASNIDDTDNLYTRYKKYEFVTSVTHKAGYAVMDTVALSCLTDSAEVFWSVNYDEDTNAFTEGTNPSYIELDTSGSTYSKSGINLDVTFKITIEWAHGEHFDYDLRQYCTDAFSQGDSDNYFSIDYDYITTMQLTSGPTLTDGYGTTTRGDYDTVGGITASGTLVYYTSGDDHPPASEIDVWVTCSDTTDPDWEATNYEATGGTFSVAVDSDDVVGQDTYNFKAVLQGAGSGGTDLFYTPYSQTYIADCIEIYSFSPNDLRININTAMYSIVWIKYQYDSTYLTTGTWTIEGESLTMNPPSSAPTLEITKSTVQGITFDGPLVDSGTARDDTHGMTKSTWTAGSITQIWDRVQVQSYTPSDARDDINDDITLDALLYYDYDDTAVTDGTVTLNGISATHQGSGYWRITRNSATVTSETYDTVAVSGNAHGITVIDQNSQSQTIIWDRVQVSTCSASDNRDNINDNVDIDFTLIYDYDNAYVTDGTVTINGYTATHQGSGVWRITRTSASVTSVTYNTVTATGNTYGITEIDMNGQSTTVIWDRIQVQSHTPSDTRINVNTAATIDFLLWYDYDNTPVTDGTVTLNGESATHQGSGVWRITPTKATVQGVTYNTVVTSGTTYDITAVDQNGKSTTQIWDRIQILTTTAQDSRIDVNTAADIRVTAQLEYDGHPLGEADTLFMNDIQMTWMSTYFQLQPQYAVVGSWNFFVNSSNANEATYGITVVNLDGKNVVVIWDRVILTLVTNKGWTVIDYNVTLSVTGIYEYDSTAWSGTWLSNATAGTHYPDETAYDTYHYTVASIIDPTYGITVFTTNTVTVIFDTVLIMSGPSYFWVQYSVTSVYLIWGTPSTYKWAVNDTWLQKGSIIHAYSNGSSPQAQAAIYSDTGDLGGLSVGAFNPSWWWVTLSVKCEYSSYNWQIWSQTLSVDILHSIHIEDSVIYLSDDYVTFGIQTNWNNATYYVWDNMTGTPVYQGGSLEGWYQIPKSTVVGTHVLIVLVNGSQGTVNPASQIATGSSTSAWEYLTFRYTVNPTLIELDIYSISESSTKVLVSGICNLAVNYYVYVSGVYQGTGSISASVSFSITVTKSLASAGSFLYGIKFNTTTDSEWFNGTYEVPQSDVFGVTLWDVDFDDVYINIFCQTTWRNSTLYIYDNGVYKAYSPEAQIVQYRKDSTEGKHVLAVKISAGASLTIWKNLTYTVAVLMEEMKIVVLQWDSGSPDSVSGMIQTNWNNATITLTNPSGTTLASGVEGGTGYGVAFTIRKIQTSGTFHMVTVTITSGSSTMTLTLGYTWVNPSAGGDSTDPRALANIIDNSTRDAVNEALSDKVVVPPAVFGGAVGLIVLLITIVISQAAWHWGKGVKRKKKAELGRFAGYL